jgi:hypothetical protein
MSAKRGDVVVVTDPFKDGDAAGRPFLFINWAETPFHGKQSIALALTTRTWHDDPIPLTDEDWVTGAAPESSSIMPWSVNLIKHEWITERQGTLQETTVDRAVAQLIAYIE